MVLVRFTFEDDPDVLAAAEDGENVLAVAKRAGVVLMSPCNGEGSCGKCLVRVVSGSVDASPSFRLLQADYDEGWRIACLSRVHGDVTLFVKDF